MSRRSQSQPLVPEPAVRTVLSCIEHQKAQFDAQFWSAPYKRDMHRIADELSVYLRAEQLDRLPLEQIKPQMLSRFLNNYRSSGRYYMNKRRNLSALFGRLMLEEDLPANPVTRTPIAKTQEVLNEAFTPDQLTLVLQHLKANHENLFLCALLTYGTLLRPHREIRLLRRKDFDADLKFITLSGKATKSGRIRRVPVPDYVRELLLQRGVSTLPAEAYLFTGTAAPINPDYFTTAWTRQKRLMLEAGCILPTQTLYSFRHSAAVYSFTNQQNLRLLQTLMGHSTPDVTVKYLRSLGSIDVQVEDLPRLPGANSSLF